MTSAEFVTDLISQSSAGGQSHVILCETTEQFDRYHSELMELAEDWFTRFEGTSFLEVYFSDAGKTWQVGLRIVS